jgi:hypothetical protein
LGIDAALNIRRCLINRPDILKHNLATGKLVQAIVRLLAAAAPKAPQDEESTIK